MRTMVFVGVLTLLASHSLAQTTDSSLATPTGHDVSVGVASYTYREPQGDQPISIHGAKFITDYNGTFTLDQARHWFAQAQVRGTVGSATYDGWCSPFFIAPNAASPNGYELDLGDASPCSESGDSDWYVEARALVGKDLIGERWAWSPYSGVGIRHLSNGTTGTSGYRTDDYLYVPLGVTARTSVGTQGPLSITFEFDPLIHGWQTTRDSALGSGDVPATPTAPAFTIDGFTDVSFAQHSGWAFRASAKYPLTRHVAVEPYFVHWTVESSPDSDETATFTVRSVTARERFGAFEPFNVTNEFGLRLAFHF